MIDYRTMIREIRERTKVEMGVVRQAVAKDHRMELLGYLDTLATMYCQTFAVEEWLTSLDGDDDLLIPR